MKIRFVFWVVAFIYNYRVLKIFVGENSWLVGAQKVSDNFIPVEAIGVVYFENAWKLNELEIWHYYCIYIFDISIVHK